MEWQMMNLDGLGSLQSYLGYVTPTGYETSSECAEVLQEIIMILKDDDETLRSRQVLATLDIFRKDLVPIIKSTDDLEIFEEAIHLMKLLTDPLESLVSHPNKIQGGLKLDMDRLFEQTRACCIDKMFIKAVVTMINTTTKVCSNLQKDVQILTMVENCFMFLRNLLHMTPNNERNTDWKANMLIRLIFETKFSDVILKMLRMDEKARFCSSISQMLTLMFKDHADMMLEGKYAEEDWSSSKSKSSLLFDLSDLKMELLEPKADDVLSSVEIKHLKELYAYLDGFCKEFVSNGFSRLVRSLLSNVLTENGKNLDDTYFLWIVSYFMKYINCQTSLDKTKPCIIEPYSTELCCALVYQAIHNCQNLMALQQRNCWSAYCQRRLHLTVCALYQMFKLLQNEDASMERMLIDIANMKTLQRLFLLLLNQFKPHLQGVLYLSDVIQTNHIYIQLLDTWSKKEYLTPHFTLQKHVSLFAKNKLMRTYSFSLGSYEHNAPELNTCILTLMHHMTGSIDSMEVLMQLPIIIIFGQMWEKGACQEFTHLIELVLHKFISKSGANPDQMAHELFEAGQDSSVSQSILIEQWTDEEEDLLMSFLAGDDDENLMVDNIVQHFTENGIEKTPYEVAKHLSKTGLLTDQLLVNVQEILEEKNDSFDASEEFNDLDADELIKKIVEKLKSDGNECVTWLQERLLETARAKSYTNVPMGEWPDPLPYSYLSLKKSVPLVAFTEEEEIYLSNELLSQLLILLQIEMPEAGEKVFPLIPYEWKLSTLIGKAEKLGEVSEDDLDLLSFISDEDMEQTSLSSSPTQFLMEDDESKSEVSKKPAKGDDVNWMKYVQHLNSLN
ncbi:protein timeless [Patella vulgata]|uniref:protein timeless n=1 Tax=Patella vulgata TaxID=6465 RepID=UPI0024A94B7B|nr:protein timeless [Patella vulgata]